MNYELTQDEISSIEKYQNNDFKIINTLLREGIESEIRINSRNGNDYPFMTRTLMEKTLNDIKNIYSAIIKSYIKNGSQKPNKKIYRGTKQSLIESMNNKNTSFLSSTININQTLTFSRAFNKRSIKADDTDKAILLINSDVPWIDIEKELGGLEGEVLFVPSKIQITETKITPSQKYGKEYIANLVEIDIPEKEPEEIAQMENQILSNTEKMSEYLKYILLIKDNPNFNNNPRTLKVIQDYSDWKKTVIEYNYQQYRIIKNKLMDDTKLYSNDKLSQKVEQEHIAGEKLSKIDKENIKKIMSEAKKENPDFFDIESIFNSDKNENNFDKEHTETIESSSQKII